VTTPSRKKRLVEAGLLGLAGLVAFSFGATPIRSCNDVWWHLKTGQLIVETGGLPEIDPFNHVAEAAGIVWHNHEWLGQIAMWRVFEAGEALGLGGFQALILAKSLLLALTYAALALCAGRFAGATLPGVVAAIIAAEVGRRTFYDRPPVYTYALLVALYALLHAARVEKIRLRWVALIVFPMFVLWANIHGGWAAGLVLLAAFAGGAFLEQAGGLYRRAPLAEYPARVIRGAAPWFGLTALAGLGTLLTPSGLHLYEMFSKVMGDPFLVANIGELQPPAVAWTGPFWLTLLALFVLSAAIPKRFPWAAEYLLVPFFAWQAIHHVRHLTLYGLLMAPTLAWLIAEALRGLPKGIAGLARLLLLGATLIFVVYGLAMRSEGGTFLERNAALLGGQEYLEEAYPAREADFLLEARLPGKLFNLDNYAGFLIWRLAPVPYQVYSDPRFDIFGGWIAQEANSIIAAEPGWDDTLKKRGVNVALIPMDKMLSLAMSEHPDWALVYTDPVRRWIIFARKSAAGSEKIARARRLFETQYLRKEEKSPESE
jgi:hypothetical protein